LKERKAELSSRRKNILLKALDNRSQKLREESDRILRKYSEGAVHDLRVASRRLIAVLETLREIHDASAIRDCRRKVKKLLDGLSPLRDLHVQRLRISEMTGKYPQLESFEKSLTEKEDQTAAKVQKLLRQSAKLGHAIEQVKRHARKGANSDAILEVIDKRYRHVLALADRIDPANTNTIHEMRLAFKKFRYTCEVAQPIMENEVNEERLKQFHTFQTAMGDIQDIEVLSARLSKWTAKRQCDAEMQPVFEELQSERKKKIEMFMASAEQVRGFWSPDMNI
jgi:CHAD domain-containing protein